MFYFKSMDSFLEILLKIPLDVFLIEGCSEVFLKRGYSEVFLSLWPKAVVLLI